MLPLDPSRLPPDSTVVLVARSAGTQPQFVLGDRPSPHFTAALWRRRGPIAGGGAPQREHLLSCCIDGHAVVHIEAGGARLRLRQAPGRLTFVPAGCRAHWRIESPREVAHLHLAIEPAVLAPALTAKGTDVPAAPLGLDDTWLARFCELLVADAGWAAEGGGAGSADVLALAEGRLLHRLATVLGRARPRPASGHDSGALRPQVLRRVEAHIQGNLHRTPSVAELAAVAGLSCDHFQRAFARATGCTPHRHVLEQRLARAAELLREDGHTVADVAHACGFASAAHFTAAFRRHRGMTPGAYRRAA